MGDSFARFATATSRIAGSPYAFLVSFLLIVVWAASGPFFGYSQTWQLVINTGTTIITFLMVFLIQNSQNRDGMALQTKLDELIRSSSAEDEFIGIEKLSDVELEALHARCENKARMSHAILEKAKAEKHRRHKR